jgi:hypothetical protein
MLILFKIIYFILEILTRYLLMPFAWLSIKIYEFRENTKNKIIYYLILIPHCLIFPITLLWTVLSFCELDIQEKIRYRKQYTNW